MENNQAKSTLAARVYECIRRDVIVGRLKPGEKINMRELCAQYDASETPVRLALNRLAMENLIEYFPRQGMRVKPLNISTCEETFDLRQMLECYYMKDVIVMLSANESMRNAFRENVEDNLALAQKLTADSPLDDYLENYKCDIRFHQLVIRCTANKLLMDMYQYINPFLYVNYVYSKQSPERLLTGIGEHREILQAMLDGDVQGAEQAMHRHLSNSKQVIISILKIENIT